MPRQKHHYYVIRNVLTGDPVLIKANNQAQGSRRFFDLRFTVELASQDDLLTFARAGVKELDLTAGSNARTKAQRQAAQVQPPGTTTAPDAGQIGLGDGITGSVSPALTT